VTTLDETAPGAPLLQPVWRGEAMLDLPDLAAVRAHAQASLAALPPEAKTPRAAQVRLSAGMIDRIRTLVEEDHA
jgi:hypothetical protein